MLFCNVCPQSVITSQSTVFFVLCPLMFSRVCQLSVSTSECTVCLFLYNYVHCCILLSVHYLLIPHTLPSVGFESLCPLLSSTSILQYHTLYRPLVLFHSVQSCLLQAIRWLLIPHTPFADSRQTADCTAALRPSSASLWHLWQMWIFGHTYLVFCHRM